MCAPTLTPLHRHSLSPDAPNCFSSKTNSASLEKPTDILGSKQSEMLLGVWCSSQHPQIPVYKRAVAGDGRCVRQLLVTISSDGGCADGLTATPEALRLHPRYFQRKRQAGALVHVRLAPTAGSGETVTSAGLVVWGVGERGEGRAGVEKERGVEEGSPGLHDP